MSWLRNWLWRGAVGLMAGTLGSAASAVPLSIVEGVWLTNDETELTIAACPTGFCGYITKIVVPERLNAQYGAELTSIDPASYTDVNNKDPNLKSRPIQGLQILTLRPTDNPYYYEGEIYNPEDGNVYAGPVEVLRDDAIKLKGCVLYVLCQEQEWARVGLLAPPAGTTVSAD
jgi:uncharacterized protein (DUF2147 family)